MDKQRPYDEYLDIPITQGVVIQRRDGTVCTNVPHFVVEHSPDGYEFGYGGSGPADLALNAIEAFLLHMGFKGEKTKCYEGQCFGMAVALHQDFKWKFICSVDRQLGATISYQDVIDWIKTEIDSMPEWKLALAGG